MTAEFAAAVPAVVIVLVLCLGGVQVAGQQVRLQDAAAIAARSVARGETAGTALDRARHLAAKASLTANAEGDLECVTLRQRAIGPGGLAHIALSARSCSLAGGQ